LTNNLSKCKSTGAFGRAKESEKIIADNYEMAQGKNKKNVEKYGGGAADASWELCKKNPVNGLVAINLHCSRRHGPWPMENQCSCDSNPLCNPPIATTPRTYLISTSEMPTKLICGLNRDMVKAMFSFPRTLSGRKRANGILFVSLSGSLLSSWSGIPARNYLN